jgi:Ca2+/Na+ antiporter
MKNGKNTWDHLFDFLLILAPFVFFLHVDIYTKTMVVFYVFYLPYLTYVCYKETTRRTVNSLKKVTKISKKKEQLILVS